MKHSKLIFFLTGISFTLNAQVLKPEDAVALALKNNFSVLLQKNNADMAANDASIGNAGMLPTVSINGGGTYASNNTRQNLLNGTQVNKNGAVSTGVNAGIGLSWVLFDGMKMFVSYDRLKMSRDMSATQLKAGMENTVASVLSAYYAVVKQKQLIKASENALLLYDERVKISEAKWKLGSASKIDFLQAQVDRNALQSEIIRQKNALNDLKIVLNNLLSRKAEEVFDVTDSISVTYDPLFDDLKRSAVSSNKQVLALQQSEKIAAFGLKETRAQLFPKITLTSSYNFARSENQAGFILLNQNLGLNAGVSASWNIFNGGNVSRQMNNSKLYMLSSKLLTEQAKQSVEASVLKSYNAYKSAKEILVLEEQNFLLAKENTDVALERFRLGQSTSIELKTAQKSFEDAQTRLVNARYEAKLAETELRRLNGELVK